MSGLKFNRGCISDKISAPRRTHHLVRGFNLMIPATNFAMKAASAKKSIDNSPDRDYLALVFRHGFYLDGSALKRRFGLFLSQSADALPCPMLPLISPMGTRRGPLSTRRDSIRL